MVLLQDVRNEEKTSKAGKPYTATTIKVNEKYYYGFGGKTTASWKMGMTVEVELYQEEYNGRMYDRFKVIGTIEKLEMRMKDLEVAVRVLTRAVKELEKKEPLPPDDIPMDLPFD